MATKVCEDGYDFGCTLSVEYEDEEELKEYFYFKQTNSGDYFRNTCKVCERRHRRELGKSRHPGYSYSRRKEYDGSDFGVAVGVADGEE